MNILCLDLEGVLVPEVWQAVAQASGVDDLLKTTRDIPVYDDLMQYRLRLLDQHGIGYSMIKAEIDKLQPLDGAVECLSWARRQFQVAIISDTFYEFAEPLMEKLQRPMLLCHRLQIEDDRIVDYHIRQPDPKRASIKAFQSLRYTVFAAGDSFNDVTMLEQAEYGFFLHAPENVCAQYPQYPRANNHDELRDLLWSKLEA